jgi:endo-beta-N-acetylglucosaminidase D
MPFDTAIPGTPVTAGIASVSDLLAWEPGQDEINRAIVPCLPRVGLPDGTWLAPQPRVQHCHDLWQGYLGTDGPPKQNPVYPGDAFPQGCANGDIYLQPWWTGVDLFVYFGHRARLMIPPPWWTNAAHRNGVPVLGTFRVETSNANGDLGMLVDPGNRGNVLGMMYKVARYYGFDGWLFNIEPIGTDSISPVSPADLVSFLTQLTALATTDTSRPWFVVWYDSLNAAGHIHYEEQLDSTNQSYFQACSGMFVDYNWQPSSMSASVSFAQQLGRQPWDVYYGIQVHRQQENTQAVAQKVLDGGLSTALFAASWTYAPNNSTPPVPNSASVYWTNELQLWMNGGTTANSLVGALGSGGRPMVKAPPYATWFNLGNGSQMSVDGVQQFSGAWGHLSQQDPALGFWNAPVSTPTPLATQTYDAQTSLNGGTSLAIQRTQGSDGNYPAADLYLCPLVVDMTEPVRVYYAVSGGEGVYLLLTLPSGPTTYALGVEGMSVPAGLTLVVPDQTSSVNGWEVRQYDFAANPGASLKYLAIGVTSDPSAAQINIGEIRIIEAATDIEPPAVTTLAATAGAIGSGTNGTEYLTTTLTWDAAPSVSWYEVWATAPDGSGQWIGRAYATTYFAAAQLGSAGSGQSFTFSVQVVDANGRRQLSGNDASVAVSVP